MSKIKESLGSDLARLWLSPSMGESFQVWRKLATCSTALWEMDAESHMLIFAFDKSVDLNGKIHMWIRIITTILCFKKSQFDLRVPLMKELTFKL